MHPKLSLQMATSLDLRKTFTFQKCFRLQFLEFKIIWEATGELRSFTFIPEFLSLWHSNMKACQPVCTLSPSCILASWQIDKNFKWFPSFNIFTVHKGRKNYFPRSNVLWHFTFGSLRYLRVLNVIYYHNMKLLVTLTLDWLSTEKQEVKMHHYILPGQN